MIRCSIRLFQIHRRFHRHFLTPVTLTRFSLTTQGRFLITVAYTLYERNDRRQMIRFTMTSLSSNENRSTVAPFCKAGRPRNGNISQNSLCPLSTCDLTKKGLRLSDALSSFEANPKWLWPWEILWQICERLEKSVANSDRLRGLRKRRYSSCQKGEIRCRMTTLQIHWSAVLLRHCTTTLIRSFKW